MWVTIISPIVAGIVTALFVMYFKNLNNFRNAKIGLKEEIIRNKELIHDLKLDIEKELENEIKYEQERKSPNILNPYLLDAAYNYFLFNGFFDKIPENKKKTIHDLYHTQKSITDYIRRHRSIELVINFKSEITVKNVFSNLKFILTLITVYLENYHELQEINLDNKILSGKKERKSFRSEFWAFWGAIIGLWSGFIGGAFWYGLVNANVQMLNTAIGAMVSLTILLAIGMFISIIR